jgi:hypothetical protein
MKDYLQDIVQHTHSLGIIDLVKIVGSDSQTVIEAVGEERTVIVQAQFHNPVPEFIGTFGMPNLGKLNTILNIPEYKEGAKLAVATQKDSDGTDVPASINFENKGGDFKNSYRFMTTAVINDQLKNVKMKPVKWGVEVVPTALSIQKLKFQSMAHSDATTFSSKTENGELKFFFGEASSHAGSFTFATTSGSLSKQLNWPVAVVNSILSLPGDKTFKISDDGVAEITVDSGLAVYHYMLPAQTK